MTTSAIVVNADDLGVSRGATLGVIRAHLDGVVTSASLAPTGADYRYAMETVSRDCPGLGLGLHFTLSVGKPISPPADVPLLVNERGYFRWEFVSLFRAIGWKRQGNLLAQIEIELEAQLQRLRSDGIAPDHINSERHVHLIPGIFRKVIKAAKRHGIPFVRAGRDIGFRQARFRHYRPVIFQGGFIKFLLLQGLTGQNRLETNQVRTCDHFASYLFTGRLDLVLEDIMRHTPAGLTEIMVHPGMPEHSRGVKLANPGVERYLEREDRRRELDACIQARELGSKLNLCTFKNAFRSMA
ncbi:MAG: ChbG/HpnK family deacetylase [Gammaproteobacteria bacterium]|nr:ChbG/HpnK family deacetylase [Gammaproteobacteria bacterium]NNJ83790.1 ChbG/HpnK family deacetylase [Gammaproteobacteria bacterium]